MSYCLDSPLYIIITVTYSNIKPLSKSASLISCLQNTPYLLASCHTFYLNPRQSSRGLCQVQVIITASVKRYLLRSALAYYPILIIRGVVYLHTHCIRYAFIRVRESSNNNSCYSYVERGRTLKS